MDTQIVDVLESGAVCLGADVVCDGFADNASFRVQTHIHEDHMSDFDKSKGLQDLFMSPGTYSLLVADLDADLEYRNNLHQVSHDKVIEIEGGAKLSMFPSNHMLGSCQVALELPDGLRIGYSSDFGWPIDKVIEVDQLVVDSTYGNPDSVRKYSQEDAESRLLEVVSERLRYGSVHIKAHRGTIERVLKVIDGQVSVPILVSESLNREIEVYQKYGFMGGNLVTLGSNKGQSVLKERSYVRLYSKGDGFGNEPIKNSTSIQCSAYMMQGSDNPVLQTSERSYNVALSNHADFGGTLDYIQSTGAKMVITDNTRSHGVDLAIAINKKLSISAKPSNNYPRRK
ncbi:MAG: hypothetical protein ACR2NQ_01020 [Thermodesulfobacteriota bacterium]